MSAMCKAEYTFTDSSIASQIVILSEIATAIQKGQTAAPASSDEMWIFLIFQMFETVWGSHICCHTDRWSSLKPSWAQIYQSDASCDCKFEPSDQSQLNQICAEARAAKSLLSLA